MTWLCCGEPDQNLGRLGERMYLGDGEFPRHAPSLRDEPLRRNTLVSAIEECNSQLGSNVRSA